jgi:hypothetical protein
MEGRMDSPLFWKLECEGDRAKYCFDWEGPYLFGPSFFFGIGTIKFLADNQTLLPTFQGVYFEIVPPFAA